MGEPYSKDMDVSLSDEEWQERSKQNGLAIQAWEKAIEHKKEVTKQLAEVVSKAELRVHELGRAIRERKESRAVLCEDRANPRMFRIESVRLDTGEIFDVRPMNDEEMADAQQGRLFNDQAANDDAPADSHTLPDHPVLETVRTAEERIKCPGAVTVSDDGTEIPSAGCSGEDCTRCAGLLFIPNPEFSPPVGADASATAAEEYPGTDIDPSDPALAEASAEPTTGKGKGRKPRAVAAAEGTH
jgi:hypothetical protein